MARVASPSRAVFGAGNATVEGTAAAGDGSVVCKAAVVVVGGTGVVLVLVVVGAVVVGPVLNTGPVVDEGAPMVVVVALLAVVVLPHAEVTAPTEATISDKTAAFLGVQDRHGALVDWAARRRGDFMDSDFITSLRGNVK